MRERRAAEDVHLAELAVTVLGPGIFTARELANRVRLLARRDPDVAALIEESA